MRFSHFKLPYFSAAVTNVKKEDVCSQSIPNTSWCKSYSRAIVLNQDDQSSLDLNMAQFIVIPDASDGHYLFQKYQTFETQDIPVITRNKAQFDVYVNGEIMEYDQDKFNNVLGIRCDSGCDCAVVTII